MGIRRKGRPKTHGSWTKETSAKAHAAKAKRRMEEPADSEPSRVPQGQLLGVLQWHAADGTVRRWTIKQGTRANNLNISSLGKTVSGGWDKLFTFLRGRLAVKRAIL
jgi:hypothetical protein